MIEEGRHEPTGELWWNESWYFDVAAPDGSWGAYVRVGLVPNQDRCWYLLHVTTPERTVRVDDQHAPLPADEPLTVHGIAHEESDGTWRISGTTTAEELTVDELLSATPGRSVEVALDLTWTTDGTAFPYEVTTRYEVPCQVSGSVTVDGVTRQLTQAPGQRDHSYGARQWKESRWCWSAARLADGTRFHVTDVELPGFRFTTGYVGASTVTGVQRTQVVDALPRSGRLVVEPGGLEVGITPLAHAPTLITQDGDTWPFHRCLARFTTAAGDGIGWVEWNEAPVEGL